MAIKQDEAAPRALTPRLIGWEIFCVFAVSLGASGVYALISLIGSLTASKALGKQHAVLNGSLAPGRPTLDLFLQLVSLASTLAPVILVFYLLARSGEGPADLGLDGREPGRDLLRGAGLAALIGGSGLGLYLAAYKLGFALNVVAESLPAVWWRIPVLILDAVQNGMLEEILVVGYLLRLAGPARLAAVPGHRVQRRAARFLPLVPGVRRVRRQRGDGRDIWLSVPAVGPGDPDDHRSLADRRRRVRRLRHAARSRVMASVTGWRAGSSAVRAK